MLHIVPVCFPSKHDETIIQHTVLGNDLWVLLTSLYFDLEEPLSFSKLVSSSKI